MERAMGIEPTLSGWEPEVLPLNYARPMKPPPERYASREREWYIPCGGWTITDLLAISHPLEICPLSRGAIVSSPIRAHYRLGLRFFQHPLPPTA